MSQRTNPPDSGDETTTLGPIAHRMNHTLSYLVSNLNSLAEAIEQSRMPQDERGRALQLSSEALESAERLADLIRQVKVLSWGSPATRATRLERAPSATEELPRDDDTWDSEGSARILVIDDETAILQACQRALQNYAVEVAPTAERALELLKSYDFDLVLCDLTMPTMSGMDLYEWIKTNKSGRIDRLMFMTGGVFSVQLRAFLAGVRNPVLHKPFDTKTLRWMIAQKLRELESRAQR